MFKSFLSSDSYFKKIICSLVLLTFVYSSIGLPAYAQSIITPFMPQPGTMVATSDAFVPVMLKGVTLHLDDPFKFDFIVDSGEMDLTTDELREESDKLVKYFLASMTIPKDDLWVNLSPHEENRIIPDALSKTELGRDLLAQEYLLKQVTSSLMYPEDELGSEFWQRIYEKAQEKYGTTDIPVDTFNKVWILPDEATVYENGSTVYVVESKLKVMLDSDYVAMTNNEKIHVGEGLKPSPTKQELSKQIIKEIILPEIEKEVNTGKNFAPLRQIYNSLILAKWYKETIKESILNKVYVDKKKTNGIDIVGEGLKPSLSYKEEIYEQYMQAYKKGVYNYIKEEYDTLSQSVIPRKYFSGGFKDSAMIINKDATINQITSSQGKETSVVEVDINPQKDGKDAAMLSFFGFKKYKTLVDAVRAGDLRTTRKMLEQGSDPNKYNSGDTRGYPLHYALHEGPKMVQLLIDFGADVNVIGRGDATALAKALRRGDKDVADVLKRAGAELHSMQDEFWMDPSKRLKVESDIQNLVFHAKITFPYSSQEEIVDEVDSKLFFKYHPMMSDLEKKLVETEVRLLIAKSVGGEQLLKKYEAEIIKVANNRRKISLESLNYKLSMDSRFLDYIRPRIEKKVDIINKRVPLANPDLVVLLVESVLNVKFPEHMPEILQAKVREEIRMLIYLELGINPFAKDSAMLSEVVNFVQDHPFLVTFGIASIIGIYKTKKWLDNEVSYERDSSVKMKTVWIDEEHYTSGYDPYNWGSKTHDIIVGSEDDSDSAMLSTYEYTAAYKMLDTLMIRDYQLSELVDNKAKLNISDVVVLGNQDLNTLIDALKLYQEGVVKRIVLSGGRGRATAPMIQMAQDKGFNIEITKDISEAQIMQQIMLQIIEKDSKFSQLKQDIKNINLSEMFLLEEESTNSILNLANYKQKLVEASLVDKGKTHKFIFIHKPDQQLRTKASFNKVFQDLIESGNVSAISYTPEYNVWEFNRFDVIKNMIGEAFRLLIYSDDVGNGSLNFKSDKTPNGLSDLPEDFWQTVSWLVDNITEVESREISSELVNLAKNTKGLDFDTFSQTLSAAAKEFVGKIKNVNTENEKDKAMLSEIKSEIQDAWGVDNIEKIDFIKNGRWFVKLSNGSRYVLKDLGLDFQPKTRKLPWELNNWTMDQLAYAVDFQNYVSKKLGVIPSYIPRKGLQGDDVKDYFIEKDGKILFLENVIAGQERSIQNPGQGTISEIGNKLASFHDATRDFIPKGEEGQGKWSEFLYSDNNVKDILDVAQEYYPENFLFVKNVIEQYKNNLPKEIYDTLPTAVIHGDTNISNFLFSDENKVVGIIDVLDAGRFPRIVDFTSILFKVPMGRGENAYYNRENIKELLKSYQLSIENPLSREELKALPYMMLLEPLAFYLRLKNFGRGKYSDDLQIRIIAYLQNVLRDIDNGFFDGIVNDLAPLTSDSAMLSAKMLSTISNKPDEVGGIDLNEINVNKQGEGVDINFEKGAFDELNNMDIDGFKPVIINITPIISVLPLLGLAPKEKEDESKMLASVG